MGETPTDASRWPLALVAAAFPLPSGGVSVHAERLYRLNDSVALRGALVEFSNNVELRAQCAARARALQASPDLAWSTIVKSLLEQMGITE